MSRWLCTGWRRGAERFRRGDDPGAGSELEQLERLDHAVARVVLEKVGIPVEYVPLEELGFGEAAAFIKARRPH